MYKKLEADIGHTQLGFKNVGTIEALFALNVLTQRFLAVNQDIFFPNYNQAFDKVQHKPLMQLVRNKNIDTRDIRIINNLEQETAVRINNSGSDKIKIKRGVR